MLAWLFRRVPLLRLIPGLPPLFDALLLGGTALVLPERLRVMHRVEEAVLCWPGVTTKVHRFGGTEFNVGHREIGHLHGHGLLDIPFSRALRDEAVGAGRAKPHHIFPQSAWISVFLRSEADAPTAIALLRSNYERWLSLDTEPLAAADVLQ